MAKRIEDDLTDRARQAEDASAIIGASTVTYGALLRWSAGIAEALERAGVRRGDRVAVWTGKSSAEVASLYGAWLAGAIVVPVHDVLKRPQVQHVLEH
ncbi:MAG: AMP-binding protein [Sandaracinaceae bacterium]